MKKLSIVILSYNTEKVLTDCLDSLTKVKSEVDFEVIVVDNASTDGSLRMLSHRKDLTLIENKDNLGFAKGNNSARKSVKGEYVLFLNSDTLVAQSTLKATVNYLDEHKDVGALTCKIVLPDGSLDKDARRSFPTPWVALTHFSLLDRLFPKSPLFARYWYGYKNEDELHEVDALQGAFFLTRKYILDGVDWYDEDYFLDGEDIDLCWKIKHQGYKIVYYPQVTITHVKKASKKGRRSLKAVTAGVNSMEIFYKKHLIRLYPFYINMPVLMGIYTLKLIRVIKYYIFRYL